jgi:hypothetical protein
VTDDTARTHLRYLEKRSKEMVDTPSSNQSQNTNRDYKGENSDNPSDIPKQTISIMKLSQIRRRIELCMIEIIFRFEMNL